MKHVALHPAGLFTVQAVVSRGSLPSSELIGIDKLIASMTRTPAPPSDLRVSSCAHTSPY
ncbi:hypothetical protein ABIA30_001491 [Mycobacterium sp. MAA66]